GAALVIRTVDAIQAPTDDDSGIDRVAGARADDRLDARGDADVLQAGRAGAVGRVPGGPRVRADEDAEARERGENARGRARVLGQAGDAAGGQAAAAGP